MEIDVRPSKKKKKRERENRKGRRKTEKGGFSPAFAIMLERNNVFEESRTREVIKRANKNHVPWHMSWNAIFDSWKRGEKREKKKKKKRSWKRRRKRRWRTMLRKIITRSAHAGIDSPVFCARHLSARSNSAVNFLDAWPPSESTRILLARPIIAPLFASLNTSYAVIISPRGFFLSFFPLLVFFFFFTSRIFQRDTLRPLSVLFCASEKPSRQRW